MTFPHDRFATRPAGSGRAMARAVLGITVAVLTVAGTVLLVAAVALVAPVLALRDVGARRRGGSVIGLSPGPGSCPTADLRDRAAPCLP